MDKNFKNVFLSAAIIFLAACSSENNNDKNKNNSDVDETSYDELLAVAPDTAITKKKWRL